jgi:hypothetical protein
LQRALPKSRLQPQHAEAIQQLVASFDELPVATEAKAWLAARISESEAQAKPLLAEAQGLEKQQRFSEAHAIYKRLVAEHALAPQASEAAARITALERDPQVQRSLQAASREHEAQQLLRLAINYQRNRQEQLARQKLQQIVDKYPDSQAAEEAQRMLKGR